MATGANVLRLRGKSEVVEIREKIEAIKTDFWRNHKIYCDRERGYKVEGKLKKVDFVKFEATLKGLENKLWYAEEADRMRRSW